MRAARPPAAAPNARATPQGQGAGLLTVWARQAGRRLDGGIASRRKRSGGAGLAGGATIACSASWAGGKETAAQAQAHCAQAQVDCNKDLQIDGKPPSAPMRSRHSWLGSIGLRSAAFTRGVPA